MILREGIDIPGMISLTVMGGSTGVENFSPLDLDGLIAWYDIPSMSGLSDTDSMPDLTDFSGNSLHGAQGVGGNQPTYRTAIQNGLPCAYLDGSNPDFWVVSHDVLLNYISGYSIHIVAQLSDGFRVLQKKDGTGTQADAMFFARGATLSIAGCYGAFAELPTANWGIFGGNWNGFLWNYLDGSLLDPTGVTNGTENGDHSMNPTNVPANNTDDLYIGKRNNPAGTDVPVTGYIGEIIIAGALTTTERQLVEGYLNAKWGL